MVNINARDFPGILNESPYEDPWMVLQRKVENKHKFVGNKYTEHGNKFESAALTYYENKYGCKIARNQPIIHHPEHNWITGIVDGININTGQIIEIKCPWKKNSKKITVKDVPFSYWIQCQVYMNILNINETIYAEYYVKSTDKTDGSVGSMNAVIIQKDNQWWSKNIEKIKHFYNEMNFWLEQGSLKQHPISLTHKKWQNNNFSL